MDEKVKKKTIEIRSSSQMYIENEQKSGTARIFSSITVEPSLFLCILPSTMYQSITMNLYLEKTCRIHLALNQTVCDALSNRLTQGYEIQESAVQNYVAELSAISTFIQGFFPFCLILFVGSWSDKYSRRKPLILAPIVGEITAVSLLALNVYFYDLPVILVPISMALPPALMGGWPCLFLGVYSYVGFLADDTNKTAKIGVCSTVQNLAFIVGLGSSGFLLGPIGFIGIYLVCLVMLIVSFVYGYFNIKDNEVKDETSIEENSYMDIFKLEHLRRTIRTCFVDGKFKRRRKIFIILLVCVITLGPMQGENAVVYLYTRLKFGWNELDFSVFFLTHSFFDIIGSTLAIVLMAKLLQWKDSSIGVLALSTTITANLVYSFAPDFRYFYAGILPDIFFTVPPIALRSLMAKVVPQNELGRSNSLMGLGEALVPSIFGPAYSTIYKNTLGAFPGTFYFVSILMYSIAMCLFIYLSRGSDKNNNNEIEENEKLKNTSDVEMTIQS